MLKLLGQLLFHWCRLEGILDEELRRLHREQPVDPTAAIRLPLAERLAAWRRACGHAAPSRVSEVVALARDLHRLRDLRNLVTHHLVEVSGRPGETPFIRCARRRGEKSVTTRITLVELEEAVEAIDQCRGRLRNLALFKSR